MRKTLFGAGERIGHGELVYPGVRGRPVVDGVGIGAVIAQKRFALVHVAGDLQLLEAVVYRSHIKGGVVAADGNGEVRKVFNSLVGLAGLLFDVVGVEGQGSQGVVHLRGRPLGILFEPDPIRRAFAGVGALRMGRPACGGAGHAVFVGNQRVRFPRGARGDGEGYVGQAFHAAVFRLGEGKVAADYLFAKRNRLPIGNVLGGARCGKAHYNGDIVQQVPRWRLNLFHHHAAKGQHDVALRVAVELVAFNQVLCIKFHVAVGVAFKQPGALGRSQRGGDALRLLGIAGAKKAKDASRNPRLRRIFVVVAQFVLRTFQGRGAHGVGRCRFGILLLAGDGYARALGRIGRLGGCGFPRFDDCACVLRQGVALRGLFLVNGVDAYRKKRASGGFAVGVGGKLGHPRPFLVVYAEHGSFQAVAAVVAAYAGVKAALAYLKVAAEALLHHSLHGYRLVADKA